MPEQFGEKSQEATPYRREQARREGHTAKSQDLASAALLVGTLVILMWWGPILVEFMGSFAQEQLGGTAWLQIDQATLVASLHRIALNLAKVMLPILGLMTLVALLANMSQVGIQFLPKKLSFDLSRIDPLKGLKRVFSLSSFVRLTFGAFKIAVVASVALASLWLEREKILLASELEVGQIAMFVGEITIWTCLKVGLALLILALLDYAFQRWNHEQELRMTSQEVREEMKQLQGDPQMIARRRAVQRQLVMNRLASTVPEADVVVTNPTELAIALKYEPESMSAPIVLAKGAGVIAQRIRRLALEHNIPVVERKPLAQILYKEVDVNQPVPAAQYAAVAEVLRYVYELKGNLPDSLRDAA